MVKLESFLISESENPGDSVFFCFDWRVEVALVTQRSSRWCCGYEESIQMLCKYLKKKFVEKNLNLSTKTTKGLTTFNDLI